MVQRRILEAQRWQIIGMQTTGMSFKAIARQMGYHYTVVSRLVRKHTQGSCAMFFCVGIKFQSRAKHHAKRVR
jgi:IS30 family transposase